MIDADGIDLVFGSRRGRAENAAGDFLGFVDRVLLRDRVGDVDRQEFGFAAGCGGRGDGVHRDLALERADRHERVERRIARHLGNLVGGELADRDLFRIDAGLRQDDAQQLDVGLCPSDHADAMPGKVIQRLDLRRRLFLALWSEARAPTTARRHSCAGWRPTSAFAGRFRSPRATARSVLPALNSAMLSLRSLGRDRRQPHRAALARKGLRHQLDQLLVLAAGRPDGNPQASSAATRNTACRRRRRTPACPRRGSEANSSFASVAGGMVPDCRSVSDIVLSRYTKKRGDGLKKQPYRSMTSYA